MNARVRLLSFYQFVFFFFFFFIIEDGRIFFPFEFIFIVIQPLRELQLNNFYNNFFEYSFPERKQNYFPIIKYFLSRQICWDVLWRSMIFFFFWFHKVVKTECL